MCDNEYNIIIQSDFDCIGVVAKHCDNAKLCIAISEAQDFDLSELLCGMWDYVLSVNASVVEYDLLYDAYLIELAACEENPDCDTPPVAPVEPLDYDLNKQLLCGGSFVGCNDRVFKFKGVKQILAYYAYSRYLILNGFNDTAVGSVRKTNEFSIPTPLKEVQSFADKYRTMGYESAKKLFPFICANKDVFVDLDEKHCGGCACGNGCNSATKAKGYGFKSSIIKKSI